jgi:hypothetical protein
MDVSRKNKDNLKWLDDLRDVVAEGHVEEVPDGWMTNLEWSAVWSMSESQTRKMLKAAVKAGNADDRVFTIKRGPRTYPVLHWKKK